MKSVLEIFSLIKSTIHSELFRNEHRLNSKFFTRRRRISFGCVISTLLQMAKKSLQIECNLLFSELEEDPVSKQAFSQARYKIGISAFQKLHQQVIEEHYRDNTQRLWKGYRAFAGDGSMVQLPEKEEVATFFGRWDEKKVPLARVFEYTEVTSDAIVSAAIGPWKLSENYLAKKQLPELIEQMKTLGQSKLLFIYDRGFPSHKFIQKHLKLNVDYLFRLPRQFNPEIDRLAEKNVEDTEIEFKKGAECYSARVIFFKLPSGETEMLLTSLRDPIEVSREDLIELYHLRWRNEESFKLQKCLMQLSNFLGESVHAIGQEFWATALMATMLNLFCKEKEEQDAEFQNREEYKVNRSVVFGSLKRDFFRALMGEITMEDFKKKFDRIARKSKIPIRPNRSYSRAGVDNPSKRKRFNRAI